jgi:hypothetical protein
MRRAALLVIAALALFPAGASADGDPASDVLLAQDVYYPYAPKTSKQMTTAMTTLLARVRKSGYPIKVALIQTPADLGAYPSLFGDTQNYANLLAKEIAFNSHPHLLIVMPSGFGGDNLGANVDSALKGIKVDDAAKSDGLVQAALAAVARIATANGHQTPVPPEATAALATSKASSKRSTPSVLVYGGPVLLTLVAVGVLILLGRRRETGGTDPSVSLGRHEGEDEGVGEDVVPDQEPGEAQRG